jgi:multiple sugar transport system substrate-binding protein
METTADPSRKTPSRRRFLQDAALVTGGLAGILATGTAPATAQSRELKMLVNSHFVPASDVELERQLAEFGKAAGVKTRLDRVAHLQLPAVLAGEVQGQKGHDLVAVGNSNPHLYSKHLENLDGLFETIGKAGGGFTTVGMGIGNDGHVKAIPWYFISFPLALRTDLIAEIGETLPDTWDDVHRIGTKLKKKRPSAWHPACPLGRFKYDSARYPVVLWCQIGGFRQQDRRCQHERDAGSLQVHQGII